MKNVFAAMSLILMLTVTGYSQDDTLRPRTPASSDLASPADVKPQDKTGVSTTSQEAVLVQDKAFCTGVEEREPVGKASEFTNDIGRLFFWTNIANTGDSTQVAHVWFRGDSEMARVTLPANHRRNRIWSSKGIAAEDSGIWRVDIVGATGDLLGRDSCVVQGR
jgi:hypothetical protein